MQDDNKKLDQPACHQQELDLFLGIEDFVRLDGNGFKSCLLEAKDSFINSSESPAGKSIEEVLCNKYKHTIEHILYHAPHAILALHLMKLIHHYLFAISNKGVTTNSGSVEIQWGYAYSLASRNRKNFLSSTPLRLALKSFILALNDSAKALEERLL